MKPKLQSFAQPSNGQRHSWRVLCLLGLFLSTLLPIGWAATPASAQTQPTYWLGRSTGTEYVFDIPLPADFAAMLTANGPKYAVGKQLPKLSTQVIDGKTYSFVTTEVSWDKDAIDRGSISYLIDGMLGAAWFTMDAKSAEWPAVAQEVKAQASSAGGTWKRAKLLVLIWPNAAKPTVRVPIPETTLAKTRMSDLGKQTKPGLYYPAVKIPANLDAFRAQMLAYGNAGRRDPDFRKYNGSKTATDLSGDTVRTQGGTEKVYKHSQTPPYFTDHVLNDKLNQMAQFQAEYTALNRITDITMHNGPTSYVDPKTGKSGNMYDLGDRAKFFGLSAMLGEAGAGKHDLGNAPHVWMASDTHFRPWFNVGGCQDQIGYGAAQDQDGKWYFIAVAIVDKDPACVNAPAQPSPAPTASQPAASAGTAQEDSFPLPAGRTLVQNQKYRSASGNHYLIFQPDGNVVVYTASNQYVWGLESVTKNYNKAKSAQMQTDGNFVVRGANDAYIWSALTQNPDSSAFLTLTPDGVLLLVSGKTNAILWASNGDLAQALPPAETNSVAQQTNESTAPADAAASTANTDALTLEIGKEYVMREADGSYRYFKLTSSVRGTYHFELCPYADKLGSMETMGTTNVMSVEAAQAQNITPTNESCTWGEQNRVLRPEVGKQYIILEANNTARYFKLASQRGETYNFELCPDGRGTMSATRPTNVMRVDVALAQNITPTNQPCDANKVPYGN